MMVALKDYKQEEMLINMVNIFEEMNEKFIMATAPPLWAARWKLDREAAILQQHLKMSHLTDRQRAMIKKKMNKKVAEIKKLGVKIGAKQW